MTELAVVAPLDDEHVWLNFAQTAELLALDRSTLTRQAQRGRVRFVMRGIGRGERLVPVAEVVRLACAYRRVPIDDVLSKLARQVALRGAVDEATIVDALRHLHATVCTQAQDVSEPVVGLESGRSAATGSTSGAASAGERRDGPRVVHLGRLLPRTTRKDAFPTAGLTEALDARRPREPQARVFVRRPRVVNLGRLRPGDRY